MIEERALVIETGIGCAWVETRRQIHCGGCSANRVCGTTVIAKALGNRRIRLRVLTQLPLQPGDEVIIGIPEDALVRGALAVYIVPLVGMFLGALFGEWFFAASGEFITILLGALGLLAGLLWLRSFTRRIDADGRFQAVVLRR